MSFTVEVRISVSCVPPRISEILWVTIKNSFNILGFFSVDHTSIPQTAPTFGVIFFVAFWNQLLQRTTSLSMNRNHSVCTATIPFWRAEARVPLSKIIVML